MEQRAGGPEWVFYEGPPTANGRPGLHHVWARVYKDLFCRFHAMRGAYVARRAGWDTHGLPVEVEVEKQLGITGKKQIEEEVGVAEFVRLCRESVYTYVGEFTRLTTRIGYWLDTDAAYWTLSPTYIESVWWHLRHLFDEGLLYEDLKVVPYCPRCGTPLSSHELGQPGVYTDEEDESAYVRFPIVDPDPAALGEAQALAVWTTTPWTLLSNTGVAVNPDLTYAAVDGLVVAEDLVDQVLGRRRIRPDHRGACPGRRWWACATGVPSTTSTRRPGPTAGAWCPPPTSPPRRGRGSSTSPRPSARWTARSGARTGCPRSTRSGPTATSPPRSPGWPARRSGPATPPSTIAWRPPAC